MVNYSNKSSKSYVTLSLLRYIVDNNCVHKNCWFERATPLALFTRISGYHYKAFFEQRENIFASDRSYVPFIEFLSIKKRLKKYNNFL